MNLGRIKVHNTLSMRVFVRQNVVSCSLSIGFYYHFQVSSIEIERICNRVDTSILETAAVGVPPIGGGPEQLTIAVVLKDHCSQATDLNQLKLAFNAALKKLNPLFKVLPFFL
jgi:hypothetical protein